MAGARGGGRRVGALHLSTYDRRLAQALLVIGGARMVLTLPYLLTRNLWSSALAHLIHDWGLFAVIILLAPKT